ncbi:hypothetical protein D16iCDA_03215 [Pseudomonas seleniipraecipitans]|jgi:hypothetical protein|uniref:Uncharacterized protein n=1 Tax=Phytopseudomonas seleniipraecipitans TaxID=640205 RepID=A0A1G7T9P5_9GAMM|nr:hypothetical protein [Pseudomonas seleniipraecipitans]UUD64723.1 hypothetical protein D16iCDA_03215 [Pseudomonas seleniipraecipitans]SDG31349.1 hypothetical protein SAMN05216381_3691 [Pseudomonas seleniipraecipitans]
MSPESYILLMISGWLMLSAAMLWGMLRLVNRYQLEAQLAEEFPPLPTSPSTPAWRRQHAPRRARLRERAYRTYQQHQHALNA